jgi:hypothetical protein
VVGQKPSKCLAILLPFIPRPDSGKKGKGMFGRGMNPPILQNHDNYGLPSA